MSKQLIKNKKGFTIIEVMIVLAIAGLIMLIVFLAVPALQRNSRNTGRRADASRVGTAATNFTANNNSSLPATAADATTLVTDAGTLSQFKNPLAGAGGAACAAGKITKDTLTICTTPAGAGGVTYSGNVAGEDGMVLATAGVCGANGLVTQGSAKQMALVYTVETTGVPTYSCIQL